MTEELKFGVLLPHFTQEGSRDRVLDGARLAEDLGFDSVWVRDHLFISPEHREHGGITDPGFVLESTLTLAAIAAVTSRVQLGTAVITPHRHAMKVAQLAATLDYLSGGRLILGIGAGWDRLEFSAVGVPFEPRLELVRETVEVCRLAWVQPEFEYHGAFYDIPWGAVDPRPIQGSIPIWYGGLAFKAVDLAVEFADGWLPSRLPFDRLEARIARARQAISTGPRKAEFTFAAMPQTALGETREDALRLFNIDKVKEEALARKPVSGGRTDLQLEDLEGYLIFGAPDEIRTYVRRFVALGVSHIVFDMRSSFFAFERSLRLLGEEVLPGVRSDG